MDRIAACNRPIATHLMAFKENVRTTNKKPRENTVPHFAIRIHLWSPHVAMYTTCLINKPYLSLTHT